MVILISPKKKDTDDGSTKHIHVILKDNRISKFEKIKSSFELNSDVDTVRTCIDRTFDSLSQDPLQIRPELKQVVDNLIANSYLKSKYLVFSINDVINEALHQWIQSRRSEINLHSISFRNELPLDEQTIANVFVEQQINFDHGLTISDIKTFINDFEELRLVKLLKKFINNGLLQVNTIKGQDYYFAPYP